LYTAYEEHLCEMAFFHPSTGNAPGHLTFASAPRHNPLDMDVSPRLAPWILTLVEAVLVLAGLLLIALRGRDRYLPTFPRAFVAFSRRKTLAVLSAGLLTIALRAALIPILGIPEPRWNDEFSYLLAAKTFAAGRLTNPTHPLWIHFETFHIIQKPTYMSMYPPGQGMVLASGERIAHLPWLGVLLITAVACSAITWMLQAWVPPEWALLGGLLAVFRFGILSYWMNSYWVPALAAAGGALVLGSYPRLKHATRLRDAVWMALGLVILANSRPYEGFVFSLPFAWAILRLLVRKRQQPKPALRKAAALLTVLLVTGAAATGYYYWRVTGSPFRFTYQVNRQTYAVVPYFIMLGQRPAPEYHDAAMRDYYLGWEVKQFRQYGTLGGFLRSTVHKVLELWRFYIGPILTIPLLAFPLLFRDRRMRFPLIVAAVCCCGWAIETWTMPHYVAPATALLYLLLVQCMRHLQFWNWRDRAVGAELVRMVAFLSVAMVFLRIVAIVAHAPLEPRWPRGNLERPQIVAELSRLAAPQLVFVRYGPHHDVDHEWVFNDPDIDHSKIVWARDMGPNNEEVLRYYPHRQAWYLDADETPPRLTPVPGR